MNYISEINGFERWLETHQLPTLAQLLWYKLAYWSSRSGWPVWTQVDNRRLMVSLQIAREASLTESRERLVNAGLIEYKKGKKGSPGRYRIISFEEKATGYTYNMQVQNGDSDGNTYNMKAQTVTIPVRKPVVYPGVQSVDIIKDKKKNKDKNKHISPQGVEKRDRDDLPAALERYTAHREAMGSPLNAQGTDALLKRLAELAPEDTSGQAAILEQSIRNGWKDIYPLSMDKAMGCPYNFEQSGTDYDALVLERVRARMAEGAGRAREG